MLQRVRSLLRDYAMDGVSDKRALENYIDCENEDSIRSLQNELRGISSGGIQEETLRGILGPNRLKKHETYMEWGRMMLLWMAAYRK